MRDTAGETRTNSSFALLLPPTHRRASVGRSPRAYLHQLCADTGGSLEDLPRAMNDRDGWGERAISALAGRLDDDNDDDDYMTFFAHCPIENE